MVRTNTHSLSHTHTHTQTQTIRARDTFSRKNLRRGIRRRRRAMQSLGLKVFYKDFNLGGGGGGGGGGGFLADRRNCSRNLDKRISKIVACSSSSSSSSEKNGSEGEKNQTLSSFISRSQNYALLKQQMEVAAKSEDYEEAARIRDSLKSFEEEEPVLRLRKLMKDAIADERFEDAAKYRDELKLTAPHSLLKCSSDATTLGIRVQVRSVYIESRSQPSKGQYFYAYRIRVTNNSERPVQLLRRHWIITDGNGKTENVWGVGVIGEQPVILPRTGFEYSSACPLSTPNGRMEGDFEMKHTDRVGSSTFNVAIAPFALSIIGDDSI